MNDERPTIGIAAAAGGWPAPWPSVAELADTLPAQSWTLVGGLMTQLHTIHHGMGIVRPTNDVDIVLHIETQRGIPGAVATALEGLGYRFQSSIDEHNKTAHRFVRGTSTVDLVAGAGDEDQVDVLIADHPAPRVIERLRGHEMVRIATLVHHLPASHAAWQALPEDHRTQAQLTLNLLADPDPDSATGGPTAAPA